MIYVSIGFFSIAILLGVFLLSYVWTGKETPKGIAVTHGVFAVLGVVSLLFTAISYGNLSILWISLIMFVLAATGGVYLFITDVFGNKVPKMIALAHGLFAISAFVVLLWYFK